MFWSFYKIFETDFDGIQERVISALIFTIGDDSPVTLNTDIMMILCCVWLIRCDVLHDRNIGSRLAANLSFFLPYACTLLSDNYFSTHNVDQHLTGQRTENVENNMDNLMGGDKFGNDENENVDLEDDGVNGKELRDKVDAVYRLRKENARIFKTLALYIQQNVIKEEKGKQQIRLADIDINDKNALSSFAMPEWSKINKNFRQSYVGIYDVVSHIATALMASWTMNEPSTLLALGDFCQYLIDVFIPTNAATLANVFSICLLIGDEYLKIGTIRSLTLFVPRLFKQCKSMNMEKDVISCFDETFERCTNLTSDENERVSQCAHEFVAELTRKGYQASSEPSRLMRSMYPSFKQVEFADDGMVSTIDSLTKILEKTEDLLQQYPDNQSIDAKLSRLLHNKPKDNINRNIHKHDSANDQSNKKMPPRRHSQMPPQQKYEKAPRNMSFIQKKEDPMQHGAKQKEQALAPSRIEFKPQKSIIAEDEEKDDYDNQINVQIGYRQGSKPKHRELLSTVSAVSVDQPQPHIMNMGSYRELKQERTLTVEKLEDVVDKHQLMEAQQGDNNNDQLMQPLREAKYKQFGSDAEMDEDDEEEQSVVVKAQPEDQQSPSINQNKMPYGVKDIRSPYAQQQAKMNQDAGHRKIPTFGAQQQFVDMNGGDKGMQSEAEEDDEDDDVEESPQQFPKMENAANYAAPPGSQMKKDYDPLSGMGHSNDSNMNEAEGGNEDEPGGVNFDIPPMEDQSISIQQQNDHVSPHESQPSQSLSNFAYNNANQIMQQRQQQMQNQQQMAQQQQQQQQNKPKAPLNMDEVPVISPQNQGPPVGDLSTFLEDNALLRTFLKFLKKKTTDYKLLEFYLMAGQFKTYAQDPKSTRSAQRNNAKLIIESFFLPDSKKFLEKIQGMTRHEAMSQFLTAGKGADLNPTLFDRARQEVKSELISRVFPIFMQSDRYKKLVKEGKVRAP